MGQDPELFENFEKQFNFFKKGYELLKRDAFEINKEEARGFNVFHIMGLGHKEVQTHTPFLHELLNPEGSHGQGVLFLKLFLKNIGIPVDEDISLRDWRVHKECDYIDLRLTNHKRLQAIFIENKIYSEAHSEQISKNYEKWKKHYVQGEGKFLYLTLDGSEPEDYGFVGGNIGKSKFIFRKVGKPIIDHVGSSESGLDKQQNYIWLLSHRNNIAPMLERALPHIKAIAVQEVVKQYIDLIHSL